MKHLTFRKATFWARNKISENFLCIYSSKKYTLMTCARSRRYFLAKLDFIKYLRIHHPQSQKFFRILSLNFRKYIFLVYNSRKHSNTLLGGIGWTVRACTWLLYSIRFHPTMKRFPKEKNLCKYSFFNVFLRKVFRSFLC